MKPPPPSPARVSAAKRLRHAIEAADAEGIQRKDMVLRLTLSDVAHLKRDASLALEDISFRDGVMRFLGVQIEPGGVAESVLERSEPLA